MSARPHPTAKGSATARPAHARATSSDTPTPTPGVKVLAETGTGGWARRRKNPLRSEKNEIEFPFPEITTIQIVASICGVTPRRIRQLCEDGAIKRTGRGLVNLADAVQGYIANVSQTPSGPDETKLLAARAARMEHLAKVAKFQAEEARRRSELLSGKAVDVDIIRPALVEVIAICRSLLLAVPSKIAAQLADLSSPAKVEAMLTEAIHEALSEIANYPGKKFFSDMAKKYRANEKRELATDREGQPTSEADDFSDL